MGYPSLLIITNRNCNNTCAHCSIENRIFNKYDELSISDFSQIIHDFKFINDIYLFGGEPSIAKNFLEYLSIININNMCPGFVTNGFLFENKKLTNSFWKELYKREIKKLNINLSIDSFHEKFFLLRNNNKDYIGTILNNIGDAIKYNIKIKLELNRVYSKDKSHGPTPATYKKIINILNILKKNNSILSYSFILEPLQKKCGTDIYKFYKMKSSPYILEKPSKHPELFNCCFPYISVMKSDNMINYYFCMFLGDKSKFSCMGNDVKKDLEVFLNKHKKLDVIVNKKNDVYSSFVSYDKSKSFDMFLNKKQECLRECRACGICNYLFNKEII